MDGLILLNFNKESRMIKAHIFQKQRIGAIVWSIVGLSVLLLLSCTDGSDVDNGPTASQPAGTGSVQFAVKWQDRLPDDPSLQNVINAQQLEPLDCQSAGIESVAFKVYDQSDQFIAQGGPWLCTRHSGTIESIPAGPDRKFVILGQDIGNGIIYQGQKTEGITIKAGEENQLGRFDAFVFVPSLLLPVQQARVTIDSFSLSWQAVQNAGTYHVLISERRDLHNPVANIITGDTSYQPSNLSVDTQYYWTVRAQDAFENESGQQQVRSFTTVSTDIEDTDPPDVPTGLNATAASASQIDLRWNEAGDDFGVNGYFIYRDGQLLTIALSTSYGDVGLIAATQYCYRVAAFDAAGNTSGQSDQSCDTTLASRVWYRDVDQDNFGDPNASIEAVSQPGGYVSDNTDCNDGNAAIHPGAEEICGDNIDQDCNRSDSICPPDPNDVDNDGDGYTENQGDCNDNRPAVHPQAEEICGDGIDQDCNGTDMICPPDPNDVDNDGDGYTENQGDCNDNNPAVHPQAEEICDGEIDHDCDGTVDEGCDQAPVIENIDYTYRGHTDQCFDSTDSEPYQAELFEITFDYKDADGNVNAEAGAAVYVPYNNTPWTDFGGDGFSGSISTRVCFDIEETLSNTYTVTLVDGAGNRSNSLQITVRYQN
jgi:hypothetical protein